MRHWVIGDTHFDHSNIIGYCNRPFETVDEMNMTMIDNWNSVVSPEDIVYHLGDFSFGKGSRENIATIREMLNGHVFLIKGNHDRQTKSWYNRAGFDFVVGGEYWHYEPTVILSHRPYPTRKPMINIHAHTHNLLHVAEKEVYCCVSVEQINYTPVDLDQLISQIRNNDEKGKQR